MRPKGRGSEKSSGEATAKSKVEKRPIEAKVGERGWWYIAAAQGEKQDSESLGQQPENKQEMIPREKTETEIENWGGRG